MEWKHPSLPYRISDNQDALDVNAIYDLLKSSYWAADCSREIIETGIKNSLGFGLYTETGQQVGFMRVVTDYATFSWVCDVIIHPDHRGKGLGKWLMQFLVEHPAISHTKMLLGTRDAHGLYEQYGFKRLEMMRRESVR